MRNPLAIVSLVILAGMIAGCATVVTRVTLLDPSRQYAPTQHVPILLEYPARPHDRIALIEARGLPGGAEAELLEEARRKAQALGADALVRLEVTSVYQPPAYVYDPWIDYPFYSGYYRYPYTWPYSVYPHGYGPYPFPHSGYRRIGGGNVQTLKAMGIKYTSRDSEDQP